MEINDDLKEKLIQLKDKYDSTGQDLMSYLDGLLHADSVKYWDYINVDTLLSLQKPRTNLPDEKIFIVYHQITELYFKLALNELEQISEKRDLDPTFFITRVNRINRYFEALTNSFEIMVQGMEKEQFLKFRMALLPASGFQSAQYRFIEFACTDLINLVHVDHRKELVNEQSVEKLYEELYWKRGAIELATGKKTRTLIEFEQRYKEEFITFAKKFQKSNLWKCFLRLAPADQLKPELIRCLKQLDVNININWPLAHYKSAVKYLHKDPIDIAATGGTNWQKYLPPRFQKRIFYPEMWSVKDKKEWGKAWVEKVVANG